MIELSEVDVRVASAHLEPPSVPAARGYPADPCPGPQHFADYRFHLALGELHGRSAILVNGDLLYVDRGARRRPTSASSDPANPFRHRDLLLWRTDALLSSNQS